MEPERADEEELLKVINKIHTVEAQGKLISLVKDNNQLLESPILSSIQPRIGKEFNYSDLENNKNTLLVTVRKQLLELAVEERRRDLKNAENKLNVLNQNRNEDDIRRLNDKLQARTSKIKNRINEKMNKKVQFHTNNDQVINFTTHCPTRKKKRIMKSKEAKRRNRQKYKENQKTKRRDRMKAKVEEIIRNNLVINLSNIEIPDQVYLYLAKGLNFVPSCKTNIHSLKFDTQNFIRKLEWKAFFTEHPELRNNDNNSLHSNLFVESNKHPDFQHTCIEKVKTKLFGWIANHNFNDPKNNLTPAEIEGQKWILEKLNEKKIFVTKADKGGATLIMNYDTVIEEINKELFNQDKYEVLEEKADAHCETITKNIKKMVIDLSKKKIINDKDKTLITGLNKNNNMKHSPEYRPETPYIYPLFKIHKLDQEQINNKVTPPSRMVNAAKYGPLYRVEKWISPYLTSASQSYCKNEYIQDTPHLTELIKEFNAMEKQPNQQINLFTIDVEKLYPSIKPNLAIEALNDMLNLDESLDDNTKTLIETFMKFILEEAFVTYQNICFKAKVGIATGGCNSRQIADIFLQWLLFKKIKPKLKHWNKVVFWKRFIDDGIGLWTGTENEFNEFIKALNKESQKYGINFPTKEVQFGKSVNFLDLTIYIDDYNKIHHKLYIKPTDARSYLNPGSFHPSHVFNSIPFSQMIRVIKRNTKDESCKDDLDLLKADLIKSGYSEDLLVTMKKKAFERVKTPKPKPSMDNNTIIFSVDYFADFSSFKKIIKDVEQDIKAVFGNISVMVATRKCSSVGNLVVKNKPLCIPDNINTDSQKCGTAKCKICPLMISTNSVKINNKKLSIPQNVNCKTKGVIYLCICNKCNDNSAYFGQTVQKQQDRMSGHREKFCIDKYKKSSLSMHSYDTHDGDLTLADFSIAIVKKVPPRRLNREEYIFIDKFDTQTKGLNRYQVI